MTIDMSQFYQVFFEESAELLEEMERLLLELDVAAPCGGTVVRLAIPTGPATGGEEST